MRFTELESTSKHEKKRKEKSKSFSLKDQQTPLFNRKKKELKKELKEGKKVEESKEKRNLEKTMKKSLRKILQEYPVKSWGTNEEENFIRYSQGYFEIVRMKGKNLYGMTQEKFIDLMESYAALSNLYSPPLKLLSINSPIDTTKQQNYYKTMYGNAKTMNQKVILEDKYTKMAFIGRFRQSDEYFLFIFGYDEANLRENLQTFYGFLGRIQVEKLTKEEKVQLLFRMNNPGSQLAPQVSNSFTVKNKKILEQGIDVELVARTQPQGNFSAKETYIHTGNSYSACLTTYRLQSEPTYLWLNEFTKIQNKILMIDMATQEDDRLSQDIQNRLSELKGNINSSKNETDKELAAEDFMALKNLSKAVTKGREILKYIKINLYLYADTLEELEKRIIEVRKRLGRQEFGVTNPTLEQLFEWKAMFLDYHSQQLLPNKRSGLDISSTVFGASFPANSVSIMDERGQYIGLSNTGGQMMVDFFEVDNSKGRTFYNILITGLMGRGKTTLMKIIMRDMIGRGYVIRGFDKSGEMSQLIRHEDGTILRLDGTDGRLNLLEIFPLVVNEETNEFDPLGCMTLHQQKLSTWYSILKPNASDDEMDTFDGLVDDLYIQRGFKDEKGKIIKQILGLAPEAYPILSDLIDLVEKEMAATVYGHYQQILFSILKTLNKLIKTTGEMFNGPTTIKDLANQQVLFFNIDGLSNYNDTYVNAQLFNAFNFFQAALFNNGRREKRKYDLKEVTFEQMKRGMFFMPEAHNLINAKNPRMVKYFNTYAREARKRYCGLCLDTQSVRSLSSQNSGGEEDSQMDDIFDFMQYRFYFQPGEKEIKMMREDDSSSLTLEEIGRLKDYRSSQTLLKILSGETYEMMVYASEEELVLFDGGGRNVEDAK